MKKKEKKKKIDTVYYSHKIKKGLITSSSLLNSLHSSSFRPEQSSLFCVLIKLIIIKDGI